MNKIEVVNEFQNLAAFFILKILIWHLKHPNPGTWVGKFSKAETWWKRKIYSIQYLINFKIQLRQTKKKKTFKMQLIKWIVNKKFWPLDLKSKQKTKIYSKECIAQTFYFRVFVEDGRSLSIGLSLLDNI